VQAIEAILHWTGYGLCHQLPSRSFFGAGGYQVPVCARDTGIYFGILLSLAIIAALHRPERPRGMPTRTGWIAIPLMIGAMALDGGTEYAGLRGTTNELRLITGLLAGFAVGALLAPMLNDELWRSSARSKVLDTPWRFAVWIAAVPIAYAVIYWVLPLLGIGYPILVALAIVAALTAVNLVIVAMLPIFERRFDTLLQAWPAILGALVAAVAEIWFAALLRVGLNALAARFIR